MLTLSMLIDWVALLQDDNFKTDKHIQDVHVFRIRPRLFILSVKHYHQEKNRFCEASWAVRQCYAVLHRSAESVCSASGVSVDGKGYDDIQGLCFCCVRLTNGYIRATVYTVLSFRFKAE